MKLLAEKISNLLSCGELSAVAFIALPEGKMLPYETTITPIRHLGRVHVRLAYPNGIVEELFFEFAGPHLVCRRSTANHGGATVKLVETGFELSGLQWGHPTADDYFYHNENPRIYDLLTIRLDCKRGKLKATTSDFDAIAGNRWCDPGVITERIGASPYQPFPAILLSNYQSEYGVVHGTLSQKIFYHNYLCGHRNGKAFLTIHGSFKAVAWRELASGAVIDDIWYLGRCDAASDFERIFSDYVKELKRHLPPMWGASNINRNSLVWGSWNDGIWRNISHAELIKQAEFLATNCPTVTWVQVDDGYSTVNTAHGLGVPYEGNAGLDHGKFPQGLKQFADEVKELGLRPAVWIGGLCPPNTKIFVEKPEWRADYDFRLPDYMVLDVSNPEVRAYMEKALDCFFKEFGFEGMKHDFWSYAFEDSHDLLKFKKHSGYEWRYWWLSEIRKRIPDDAYLQTGCDIVMANPFLGEFFTNYRYGIDIGSGNWDNVKTNFLWGMACFATHTGDLFVPNSDSVGLFPGLTDREARLCLNYCLISRSMVELAGWLYKESPEFPRFKMLKKAICCPNNGQDVYFAGFDYRRQNQAPAKWYIRTPHFSPNENLPGLPLRTVAIFNLDEKKQTFKLPFTELGLAAGEYRLTEVWQNRSWTASDGIVVELDPHDSFLLAVSRIVPVAQILDADLKVDAVEWPDNKTVRVSFEHSGRFTLTLSLRPVNCSAKTADGCWLMEGDAQAGKFLELKF